MVDEILDQCGRLERRHRLLPARVVVYYVLGLALFSSSSYEEVMRILVSVPEGRQTRERGPFLGSSASESVPWRGAQPDLIVLMPVYNDWQASALLLVELDRVLAEAHLSAHVVLVDDGSTVPPTALESVGVVAGVPVFGVSPAGAATMP